MDHAVKKMSFGYMVLLISKTLLNTSNPRSFWRRITRSNQTPDRLHCLTFMYLIISSKSFLTLSPFSSRSKLRFYNSNRFYAHFFLRALPNLCVHLKVFAVESQEQRPLGIEAPIMNILYSEGISIKPRNAKVNPTA